MDSTVKSIAPSNNRLLVDWISFSAPGFDPSSLILYLGLSESDFISYPGRYGYKHRLSFGGIHILYDHGDPGTPIACEMSGQGCRDWETFGSHDYEKLWRDSSEGKIQFARIDLAYDDVEDLIPFDLVLDKAQNQEYVSPWRCFEILYSDKGNSVLFGSKQSNCYCRIYDKAAERGLDLGVNWIRFETVFKKELAQQLAREIYYTGICDDSLYFSLIKGKLRFVEPSDDSNKSRWKTSYFWDNITNNTNHISLSQDLGVMYNLKQKETCLFNQYGKLFITILLCRGFNEMVDSILASNITLNSKYKKICMQNGLTDELPSISKLYELKSAIDQIRQEEFEFNNPHLDWRVK